jgi:hypothetical protein
MTQLVVKNKERIYKEWMANEWSAQYELLDKEWSVHSYTITYVFNYIFRGSRKVRDDFCKDITDAIKSYQKLKHMYK